MTDLDYFVFDLVIFIIVNDYGNVGVVLNELKSDFSGWLHEEKMKLGDLGMGNRPKTGVGLWINWHFVGHGKIIIFGVKIPQWLSVQWALELLNFELYRQSYGHFTEDCTEYIGTENSFEQWNLWKTGIDWLIENSWFLVCG